MSDSFDFTDPNIQSVSGDNLPIVGSNMQGGITAGTNGMTDLTGGGSSSGSGLNLSSLAPLLGLGGLLLNNQANTNAQNALGQGLQQQLAQADPWSQYRSQYGTQLNSFMQNPSSYLQTPYAQGVMNAGTQAVARSGAAQGYVGSGNMANALQTQGQNTANGLMQTQFNDLYQLSGAGQGQLAGADIVGNIAGLNAAKATNTAGTYNALTSPSGLSTISQGLGALGSLGSLGSSLFGSSAGGGGLFGSLGSLFSGGPTAASAGGAASVGSGGVLGAMDAAGAGADAAGGSAAGAGLFSGGLGAAAGLGGGLALGLLGAKAIGYFDDDDAGLTPQQIATRDAQIHKQLYSSNAQIGNTGGYLTT